MKELRECPFCGGKAEVIPSSTGYGNGNVTKTFYVRCRECGVMTRQHDTSAGISDAGETYIISDGYKKVTDAWNRRVGEKIEEVSE